MTRVPDVLRAAMTTDDRLDDVTRARMWSRLDKRLHEAEAAPRMSWRRWVPALALAAAVVCVAVVAVELPRDGGREPQAFVAPAHTTLTAALGAYTHAALVGPAELEVVGEPAEATTVRLDRGTLLAEFTGGGQRSLRILAPGMTVDIVGTLFAVEVRDRGSCVSVAHGRVRVTIAERVREVGGGERLCSDDDVGPRAIEPAVQQELAQHEAMLAAQSTTGSAAPETQPRPQPQAQPQRSEIAIAAAPALAPAPVAAPVAIREPDAVRAPVDRVVIPPPPPRTAVVPAPAPAPAPRLVETSPPAPIIEPAPAPSPPAIAPPAAPPAVAPPAPATPAPATPPPVRDEDLYRAAELALSRHDAASADRALAQLLEQFPGSSLTDQALYERARLAYDRHAWSEARRLLDSLAAHPSPLAEPGRYLTCRIAIEVKDGDAARCIADYRASYPDSPHDLGLLGALAQLQHAGGGCAAALTTIDELTRRYPRATATSAWRARCPEPR